MNQERHFRAINISLASKGQDESFIDHLYFLNISIFVRTKTFYKTIRMFHSVHLSHRLPVSLWNSSLETASAQESKYFCRVSTCRHRMSRKVSISASFSRNLCPFWVKGNREKYLQLRLFREKEIHAPHFYLNWEVIFSLRFKCLRYTEIL